MSQMGRLTQYPDGHGNRPVAFLFDALVCRDGHFRNRCQNPIEGPDSFIGTVHPGMSEMMFQVRPRTVEGMEF